MAQHNPHHHHLLHHTQKGAGNNNGTNNSPLVNNTTSIVDISEIEDDDEEDLIEMPTTTRHNPTTSSGLYLFHEDGGQQERSRITNLISSMRSEPAGGSAASRAATPMAMIEYPDTEQPGWRASDRSTPAPPTTGQQAPEPTKANLGTLSGVYFPCVQNIFGVILFIRMVWIVGTAGVPAAFALVFICCSVTLTTSISLSAIATNGIVPAGGSYFMISRSLGPECGGAVGTMFFLGTTVAGAMYITGAVEIMLNYLCPSWGLFGDFQRDVNILYHNIRVYGTLLLMIVGVFVWIGVRFVSKLAPIALFCVLLSIASIYLGIFINYNGRPDLVVCAVGDRLVTLKNLPYEPNLDGLANQLDGMSPGAELMSSSQNSTKLTEAQLAALRQFRRTKELCTYEKLRYVFCPNLAGSGDSTDSDQQQQQGQQNFQESNQQAQDHQGSQLDPNLFKRPPNMSNCDPYFRINRDRIRVERAVPGIASGVIMDNLRPRFRNKGTFISYDDGEPILGKSTSAPHSDPSGSSNQNGNNSKQNNKPASLISQGYNYIFVDITTSFTILISIYFPSCTGILAGSNRSGDLADAQKSIPLGTIAAQLTTSFVYLSCIVLFGSTFNNLLIRDKFGESTGGQLAVTQIAWPHPYVILIGGLLSTLGAALQSLVGAPRILQGIAKDEVIPCFNRFAKLSDRGEPERAILFTLAIAWLAVLIGNLDFIAPILTLSLVMCYFFINLACTLHSLLGSPSWRPRFRHYHWSISTLGCFLCLFVMIVSSWLYFLVAIFLASCIYKYIEFSGAEKEWGDGKQGLALSAARYNLLRLRTSEQHTKNWRPQVLLFCKLKPARELEPESVRARPASSLQLQIRRMPDGGPSGHAQPPAKAPTSLEPGAENVDELEKLRVAQPKLLTFASQLKAGKGLTLVSAVIEGKFQREAALATRARISLQEEMQRERVKGFADVLVARNLQEGLSYQVQSAGLGGLKHNTVVVGWPERWRRDSAALAAKRVDHELPTGTNNNNKQSSSVATPTKAHRFIELMRDAQASQNALLVVKGADGWPESVDRLGGYIDIWWIVNDGGLLMLLGHLLRQHRTWKHCQLRIFTVASQLDDGQQMRKDLAEFLYHLRIEAQVDIVEMKTSEISDYAYERTLMMEQRAEIVRRLNANGGRRQSILLEQELEGRVIRFRIRKPSLEEELAAAGVSLVQSPVAQPTSTLDSAAGSNSDAQALAIAASFRPDEANVRRMQTALALNEAILKRSKQAKLVILNLPGAPKKLSPEAESNYMEFVDIITDKLERVLLVQNGGREVITIHS